MGGVVQAAGNAVSSAVNTVKDAVQTVATKPLQGVVKVAELPLSVGVNEAASLAPATKGIPIIGQVTAGAGAASKALDSVEAGKLPNTNDLRDVVAAGGAIAGAGLDGGIFTGSGDTGFDFSSFLNGMNSPGSSPRPAQTITIHSPAPASSGGFFPAPSIDFTTIALLAGAAIGGYFILKGV